MEKIVAKIENVVGGGAIVPYNTKASDVSVSFVSRVDKHRAEQSPIRSEIANSQDGGVSIAKSYAAYIQLWAKVYLPIAEQKDITQDGDIDIETVTYNECATILITKFQHISINEVREALRMYSCGEIETTEKLWYGRLTGIFFASIIQKYCDERRKAVAVLENQKQQKLEMEKKEQRAEKAKGYLDHLCSFYEGLKIENGSIKHWNEVSLGISKPLRERGYYDSVSKDVKLEISREAKEFAISEVKNLALSTTGTIDDRKRWWRVSAELEKDPKSIPQDIQARWQVVYEKMITFRCLAPYDNYVVSGLVPE